MPDEKTKGPVPRLRFPEYRDAGPWEVKRLGDLGPVSMCKRVMKAQTSPTGDVPFYKIGTFGNEADAYISRDLYEELKSKYSFPKKGDILISAAGTIGRTVVYDGEPAYFQDSNIVWIANDEKLATNGFLNFAYQKVRWRTDDNTISRLYNDNLRSIKIALPSLPEQQKIADCLGSLDDLIRAEEAALEALKKHKKGLMQQLFPAEGETTPRLRFPEFRDAGPWEVKRLGDLGKILKGKGISKSDITEGGALACIHYGELYTHYPEVIREIVSSTDVNPDNLVLSEKNDVIIPASGETREDIATASCLTEKGVALGGDLNIFRSALNGAFLAYYIRGNLKAEISRVAQGNAVVHLYPSQLEKVKLAIPPKRNEQQKIADFLSSLDDLIRARSKRIEALKQHKKGLMQQLFPQEID